MLLLSFVMSGTIAIGKLKLADDVLVSDHLESIETTQSAASERVGAVEDGLFALLTATESDISALEQENSALSSRVTAVETDVGALEQENSAALSSRVTATEETLDSIGDLISTSNDITTITGNSIRFKPNGQNAFYASESGGLGVTMASTDTSFNYAGTGRNYVCCDSDEFTQFRSGSTERARVDADGFHVGSTNVGTKLTELESDVSALENKDVTLASATTAVSDRVTATESDISALEQENSALSSRATATESDISALENSVSATTSLMSNRVTANEETLDGIGDLISQSGSITTVTGINNLYIYFKVKGVTNFYATHGGGLAVPTGDTVTYLDYFGTGKNYISCDKDESTYFKAGTSVKARVDADGFHVGSTNVGTKLTELEARIADMEGNYVDKRKNARFRNQYISANYDSSKGWVGHDGGWGLATSHTSSGNSVYFAIVQ